jgi:4-hydroxy-4-methyl-2-oxoglutarate aldolase
VNIPILCAGQLVNPGDAVVADDDGVVIVRRDDVATVLNASRQRAALEEQKRLRLAAGELGLDIYDMRERLAQKGLVYYDRLDQVEE